MPDEPGYVSVNGIREGDPLSKSDLNNTKDSWKDIDYAVGELNLREEGLDRRVFEYDRTWNDFLSSTSRCYLSQIRSVSMPGQAWEAMNIGGSGPEAIVGGINAAVPTLSFQWSPQHHTYVIIGFDLMSDSWEDHGIARLALIQKTQWSHCGQNLMSSLEFR